MGTIIPSVWFEELIGADIMPEDQKDMLMKLMKEPEGYIVVGILVPVAEEMVFRGAILRKLLELFHSRMYWWAIVLSALLFGVVHGNMAQGLHAFLLGLLLGWMYWRTNSIVPGIVLHWINNTVAFVLSNLIPGAEDARLVDIFGGDQRSVYLALAFSLCIFLPSLYQLTIRLKKEES
jgi:membrane protease YdiL (CAAX protease family)